MVDMWSLAMLTLPGMVRSSASIQSAKKERREDCMNTYQITQSLGFGAQGFLSIAIKLYFFGSL